MIGSSHGGYISHLAAKIAPWLIDGIIDNSSYAKVRWSLIGFGKEIDYTKYPCFIAKNLFDNICIFASDKTHWTLLDKSLPNYFNDAREEIRDVLNLEHLKVQSGYKKPIYVSYHSENDHIAPFAEKIELYEMLRALGFDATLNTIINESQVDGKFIKNLSHGMDMSIKSLIKKELSPMLGKISHAQEDICNDKSISYKSVDMLYKFYEKDNKIEIEVSKI
ncbi:DUF2920 family protein [Campylobacter anatolicus]|uniref:DUF2920 family protein n=1 Tax=Campylobacter anatolicus TaxID=2829105 RepID=UPI0039867017